jgi:hypothetical protein
MTNDVCNKHEYDSPLRRIKFILHAIDVVRYYLLFTFRCHLLHTNEHSCKSLYGATMLRIYSSTSSGRSSIVLRNLMNDPEGIYEFILFPGKPIAAI